MSTTHQNSKYINSIDFNNLSYLTDTYSDTLNGSDYNLSTGKPLNNLQNDSNIDNFFVNICEKSLAERNNINNQFIYDYPSILDLDSFRDLHIMDETRLDCVFVMEGASMKNMFGYYFYEIVNGEKKLLDNDGTSDNYYRPTIIFPHVYSDPNVGTSLQTGDNRTLKGNLPNGNFKDIYVGFFLIPHGWYAYENSSDINNDSILYSTVDFCSDNFTSEHSIINDKIYSVFAKSISDNNDELLFIGFEDIVYYEVDDLDYNDCVVGIKASDVSNIENYNLFPELIFIDEENKNNIIFVDADGEYIEFRDEDYNISDEFNHIFERHLIFDSVVKRDEYLAVYSQILTNYVSSVDVADNGILFKIIIKYLFRKNDIKNANKNKRKKLYLSKAKYNRHMLNIVTEYKKKLEENLKDENYMEVYKLYQTNDPENPIISFTDNICPPQKVSTGEFRIIGNGIMDCIKGRSHLPFKTSTIYQVYKNMSRSSDGLVINVKMDNHPDGYMLGTKTFVRYVSFIVNTTEHVILDLDNLNVFQEVNETLIQSDVSILNNNLQNINISDIKTSSEYIKKLVKIFRNNSGATYRIVTVNGMEFYCIRFPNIKNNPTMIFLDNDLVVDWVDSYNNTGGTYFVKQKYYPVPNYTTIL